MKKLPLLLLALAVCGLYARAQQTSTSSSSSNDSKSRGGRKTAIVLPPEKSNPIKMPRFDKPPVIDGKLDDEVWKQAIVLKDFYQIRPGDNIAPSKPTEVFIGYDSKTLYFGFHCYDDERDKVRATVAKRAEVFGEDNVAVFLDTFNEQ